MFYRGVNRQQMLEKVQQMGVSSRRVIKALEMVDRKLFVPREWQGQVYEDGPLPIGFGQTISQPYTVARMCELLIEGTRHRVPGTRALEIGTGSGWQTAILARLFKKVYSVEIVPDLARVAKLRIENSELRNVLITIRDGKEGWPEYAPYDAIICGANADEVPKTWIKQLAGGGRIICPVKGVMTRITKVRSDGKIKIVKEEFGDYSFVPLV